MIRITAEHCVCMHAYILSPSFPFFLSSLPTSQRLATQQGHKGFTVPSLYPTVSHILFLPYANAQVND
jgi:hypothetical protein